MAERLPTLKSRVVLSSAAVAALVGLLAAGTALGLVRQQQRAAGDRRLLELGQLFSGELEGADVDAARQAEDENAELEALGLRLTLSRDGQFIAGDAALAAVTGCEHRGELRACAWTTGPWRIVVSGRDTSLPSAWWWLAGLLAAALSAAVGAGVSFFVGGWALRSLLQLEERVRAASGEAPLSLGAPASTAEVEALRAALDGLVSRLAEALERSRVFASSAAHELRTPLATLSAELEVLAAGAPPREREAATRALRTLRRLSILVDRLLALARGDLGPPRPFETIALEDVVREVVAARDEGERARLSVKVDDPGMTRGDEVLLGAVIDNLVDNGLKYSKGAVVLRVAADESQVTVEVRDEGEGPPPGALPALLKPFERGDSQVPGHGLGLAIVTRAVDLHHGSLRFEGATARVSLPRWQATGADA